VKKAALEVVRRDMNRNRKMIRVRKTDGACTRCSQPAVIGYRLCEKHLTIQKAHRRGRYEQRKDAKLCPRCGEKAVPGHRLCQKHLDSQRAYQCEMYQRRKAAGLCTHCDERAIPGYRVCKKHLDRQRTYELSRYQIRKHAGLCVYCKERAMPGRAVCSKHREYANKSANSNAKKISARNKALYEKYKLERKCVTCGEQLTTEKGLRCASCRKKRGARSDQN
jgi:hypothetical protein